MGVALASLLASTPSRADIPAGYAGKPHGGTARAIPGRVNLIDYDEGGSNVGFNVVHQGDVGCAGYDYRTDKPTPTLCKTSAIEKDHWSAGPMMGMQYPTADTADYYVGAIRPNDWVQVTVDVKQAGMYQLSTSWASAGGMIDVKISFNGTLKTEFKSPGTGDYHNWIPGPNFAMVPLDAGVQVMRFQSVVEHVNMDYVQFSLIGGDGGVDPSGSAGSGATGSGGATGAAGTGGGAGTGAAGATGAAGNGTTTGAAGTGIVTGTAGATGTGAAGTVGGGTTGAAGDAGATGAAGSGTTTTGGAGSGTTTGTGTGAAGTGAPLHRASSGGCAVAGEHATRAGAGPAAMLLVVVSGLALRRRRRARR